ncbi:ABC transporter permease [Govanella unica]|uniref:Transport permease protein n=1 Tax=Govanella unica TaxID=2975056 RepID=A0A9X3TZF6_9PROT|nr:ABC transporter permease [Govania unica]MDA5194795.1 ABC transporter permease [Govania unica]
MSSPAVKSPAPCPGFAERRIGRVNWLGFWTMYLKEIRRFWKVAMQTVFAPAITTLLFLAIFSLALGGHGRVVGGVPFEMFLAPGLIAMTILQNSFANTSSSILIAKVQGNIIDVLMPPLSPGEVTAAYLLGGVTRGVLCGFVVTLCILLFVPLQIAHPLAVLYFGISGACMLSILGILTGIWAEKFDHAATVTNFIVTPMSFLSGTFYSIERLPGIWHTISQFNPFFYVIDGFRYGFLGHADGTLWVGVAVTLGVNLSLGLLCYGLFRSGYKLRP